MTNSSRRSVRFSRDIARFLSVWGLLIVLLALIALFSALRPNTFPTAFNFQSILSNKSISAMAALAAMISIAANRFDLSMAFVLGISQVLAVGLQGVGIPWPIVAVIILGLGAAVGFCNGILVTVVGIDSFIATLGTGTMILGVNQWYTGGHQIIASMPDSFLALSAVIWGVPLPALYVLVISIVLWIGFEYLPVGRFLYVLGVNPKAGQLNGISERRYVTRGPHGFGLDRGMGRHCPAIAIAGRSELGRARIPPARFHRRSSWRDRYQARRVNVSGTILAVAVLAVTVAGLNQLGAPYFVEALFNGFTLVLAVGLAVVANRRRTSISDGVEGSSPAASVRISEAP